ncbi:flagellar basal body P-ring formation chaperone FlgA [Chelatococcus sp. GW1]|nr:flagellar basal body P-ring formation chaperone FlgA [Chelatococcus sp. GW1]
MFGQTRLLAGLAAVLAAFAPALALADMLPVPAATIRPGDVITESMLTERAFPPGYTARFATVEDARQVIGKSARRVLLPGNPIPYNAVSEPEIVKRGVAARLVFEAEGLVITALATPLQSAGAGEFIRVRNVDSGLIVSGIVQPDGSIRVGMP